MYKGIPDKNIIGLIAGFLLLGGVASAQVTGGQYAFEFLRMSNSPHVSALGGLSVADPADDISLALQNPAMMRPGMHNELAVNYNGMFAGISASNLAYGYYDAKIATSFFFGVQYLNYGTFAETDPQGNQYGTFHADDYALTLGASRSYLQHWRYGADLKLAKSDLYVGKATAVVGDVGINYYDTASLWDIGATAKNMGVTLKKYTKGLPYEPVPFDLQLGVSKRFKHLPLRLMATMHHLYEWNVRYDNPADDIGTNALGQADTANQKGSHFGDKLFRHFIFGAELTLGKRVVLTVSYNYMQRKDMLISTDPGLAGYGLGVGIYLNKFQVHYGRTYYSIAGPYNEIGLTMSLNKLFGLGTTGEKINWNEEYPDWE